MSELIQYKYYIYIIIYSQIVWGGAHCVDLGHIMHLLYIRLYVHVIVCTVETS